MKRWGILLAIAATALACNDRYDNDADQTTTTPPSSMSNDTTTVRTLPGDTTILRDTVRP